ncbi:hypothetical protein ACHAXA_008033 [Cyclostephanos tholiformis]|uniref:G domain-containing protein n=1 Tax=Cyclostephanos tholiformis TaxID=382380 RepID=A0ABD3RFK9_9STRA
MGGGAVPKGTLYVTVGPQCAGKTTILKNLFGKSVRDNKGQIVESIPDYDSSVTGVDVTIDDQELVYVAVPTSYFLQNSTPSLTGKEHLSLNQTLYGKTIHERIHDPSNAELALVVMRLGGTLGAEEFALRLQGQNGGDTPDKMAATGELIDATEHVIQQRSTEMEGDDLASLPNAIDLFVAESIFLPRPLELLQRMPNECTTNQRNSSAPSETLSALDQALHLLNTYAVNSKAHPSNACLSWGNTNTRPREFQPALEAAELSGRAVEFIVFGGMEACEMIRERVSRREYYKMNHNIDAVVDKEDCSDKQKILCLPKIDRKTLLVRNLRRFLKTGRYIPQAAISDAMVRVESLLAEAVTEANKDFSNEDQRTDPKFLLDYELAKLAGYHLNSDRTVTSLNIHGSKGGNKNAQSTRNSHRQPRSSAGRSLQPSTSYGDSGKYASNNNSERGCEQVYSHQPRSGGNGRWQHPARYRDGGGGRGKPSYLNQNSQERQRSISNNNSGRGYDQTYRQDSSRKARGGVRENNFYQSRDGIDDAHSRDRKNERKRGHDGN